MWTNITPPQVPTGGIGGNNCDYGTLAFVIEPHTPTTLYLGTCNRGLYKTTSMGTTWVRINTGLNGAVLDFSRQWTLLIDPVNPQILYTNSGYGSFAQAGVGENGA